MLYNVVGLINRYSSIPFLMRPICSFRTLGSIIVALFCCYFSYMVTHFPRPTMIRHYNCWESQSASWPGCASLCSQPLWPFQRSDSESSTWNNSCKNPVELKAVGGSDICFRASISAAEVASAKLEWPIESKWPHLWKLRQVEKYPNFPLNHYLL